jgi:hypothetical protein
MTIPIDTWDSVRIALGAGIVWANWGVFRGVSLEEESDPWTKETGKRLLLRSLLAETALALLLLFVDSAISIRQQAEIIRLTTPRNLSPGAVKRVEAKVCPFGPKQFDIVFVTFDEILFGNELQQVWAACSWTTKGVQDDRAIAVAAASEVAGLHFLYDSGRADEFKGAAEAFASALRDENIVADAGPIPKDIPLSTNIIHIQLGRRP